MHIFLFLSGVTTGRGAEEIGQLLFLGRLETSLDPSTRVPLNHGFLQSSVNCWVKKYKSGFFVPGISLGCQNFSFAI